MVFVAVKSVVHLAYLAMVNQKVKSPLIRRAAFFEVSKSVKNTERDTGAILKICVTFETSYRENQVLCNL